MKDPLASQLASLAESKTLEDTGKKIMKDLVKLRARLTEADEAWMNPQSQVDQLRDATCVIRGELNVEVLRQLLEGRPVLAVMQEAGYAQSGVSGFSHYIGSFVASWIQGKGAAEESK